MIIPLLLLLILIVFPSKLSKENLSQSYLSISSTQAIKGIFVVTIFFSHFCSYVDLSLWYDVSLQKYCSFLGQLMVAPFLLYSGFGIFESLKKKGLNYIKAFPKKRILKTWLHFNFAVILYLLLDFAIENHVSISQFLLSLIAWESIGNSNWFIFAILYTYLATYAGLVLFKGNLQKSLIFIVMMSLAYIVIVFQFKKQGYWVDTILAFPLGCTISLYKKQFEILINKQFFVIGGGMLCSALLLFSKIKIIPGYFINSQIALFSFSLLIIFVSLKIQLNSKILNWFGRQVFGIYILQRLPMNFFSFLGLNKSNVYLFFFICFTSTLILSTLFSKWNHFFDRIFLRIN